MSRSVRMLAIAGLLVGAGLCSAGEWGLWEHVDGRPEGFHKHETERMAVWHEKDGNRWFLVATTAGHRHHFKGEIKLEGPGHFTDIKEWKGEGEWWKEKEEHNWFHKALKKEPEDHPKRIYFDIVAEGGTSGITFTTEKCGAKDEIKWELFFGGAGDKEECKSAPDRIFVGKEGQHPEHGRFKTWCHPDEHGKGH
ncbi:MAG TPA: hypothetical protein VFF73_19055 [Planctomycetota bacterium]|nr:hypothetical protein [Planctomycetota bacterium]